MSRNINIRKLISMREKVIIVKILLLRSRALLVRGANDGCVARQLPSCNLWHWKWVLFIIAAWIMVLALEEQSAPTASRFEWYIGGTGVKMTGGSDRTLVSGNFVFVLIFRRCMYMIKVFFTAQNITKVEEHIMLSFNNGKNFLHS